MQRRRDEGERCRKREGERQSDWERDRAIGREVGGKSVRETGRERERNYEEDGQ